jgi:hypothetical protein
MLLLRAFLALEPTFRLVPLEPARVKRAPGCLALWGNKPGNVLALLVLVRDQTLIASTHANQGLKPLRKADPALRQG